MTVDVAGSRVDLGHLPNGNIFHLRFSNLEFGAKFSRIRNFRHARTGPQFLSELDVELLQDASGSGAHSQVFKLLLAELPNGF